MRKKIRKLIPSLFFNMVSIVGAAISAISVGLIIFLFALELFGAQQKPYMGIITIVILPSFFLVGIAVILIGMRIENKRRLKTGVIKSPFPILDFNDSHQRGKFAFISAVVIFILLTSAFTSFQIYEYTESVEFCGEVCHAVMKPEYTAYMFSPHAKVTCAECHVGTGADWYVKSKLTGAYQVYSVLFEKYSRPIPTPVHNLRPAQGTCEQCHWPKHFYRDKQIVRTYYMPDEKNTPWTISLLMKIGGGNPETGVTSGIHWHMNINNHVTYTAIDERRQDIPVIRVRHDGTNEDDEYVTTDEFDKTKLEKGETRKMDCIDCHNRPTHIYRTPEESINSLMKLGWIPPSLPSVRTIASSALTKEYKTNDEAMKGIESTVWDNYNLKYPAIAKTRKSEIDSVVSNLRRTYARNIFPEMKTNWKNFPNNIGHYSYAGCFRCHDGKHVSKKTGKVLSKDCNLCHTISSQGQFSEVTSNSIKGLEFKHPIDIGDSWKTMNCNDCHKGE